MKDDKNIVDLDKPLNWFDRCLAIVEKYRFKTIFKAVIVILIVAGVIGFINNPTWIIEKIEDIKKKEHTERVEMAMKNTQLIQYEIDALREKVDASRVILLTFHNQKQTLQGVPYIYLTAQNESIDYGVAPVAEKYESLKCSLYPFVNYIIQNEYFAGDIEKLTVIDKSLAYRMMGNDVKHCSMLNIEGDGLLGVLVVSYTYECVEHNCSEVEKRMRKSAVKIGILLNEIR